ncbi:MAG TPA: SWIM zinc finger family protein [Sandaracinaceae bacterium LLY-WYZ-13_1]|nr:SWIM zinc finger family protein [Sandaracinaceae bacterium LLY-WYZ-13_1]
MRYALRYRGASQVAGGPYRTMVKLAPNLSRERVWFDGELRDPLRFREAISALHDVVIGDLRFEKKDRAAYQAFLERKANEEAELRQRMLEEETRRALQKKANEPLPEGLEARFRELHRVYWERRRRWARELMLHDPQLFRHLVPCDPVVTVAPDAVFFECFAKDEASYGCLLLDRDGFEGQQDAGLGTTNVDYSLGLFEHFQTLRSYRETRLHVDPEGFEVRTEGAADVREEKIDLPSSWLRGFGQISAATALPSRTVDLPVEAVYSILAHLARHREKHGPRSIRFDLEPGRSAILTLDPWEVVIPSRGRAYAGEKREEIKVWGRRRLMVLGRLLPIAERFEVHLLGSGMPSIWIAHCGEMRFVLALSGWTTNDWTSAATLQLLSGTWQPDVRTIDAATSYLRAHRTASAQDLADGIGRDVGAVRAAMHRLCEQGQAIYDFAAGAYRWRQVVDRALGDDELGPEPPELTKGRTLFIDEQVTITRDERIGDGRRLVMAKVGSYECESLFDADGVQARARCGCSHFHRFKLKKGPCRHLIALRLQATVGDRILGSAGFGGGVFGRR